MQANWGNQRFRKFVDLGDTAEHKPLIPNSALMESCRSMEVSAPEPILAKGFKAIELEEHCNCVPLIEDPVESSIVCGNFCVNTKPSSQRTIVWNLMRNFYIGRQGMNSDEVTK